MVTASLLQHASMTAQSDAISGLDFTPFRVVVRRVTPFALEPATIVLNGQTDWGKTSTVSIPRNADLIAKMWLVIEVDPITTEIKNSGGATEAKALRLKNDFARQMIERISIEAGAITYQVVYPDWLYIWDEYTTPHEKRLGEQDLTGLTNGTTGVGIQDSLATMATKKQRFYVPIQFFFTRTYGHALPIVSLHLTDVQIKIKLRNKDDLWTLNSNVVTGSSGHTTASGGPITGKSSVTLNSTDLQINDMYMLGEYVYLSDMERDRYARTRHVYLIEQTQRSAFNIPQSVSHQSLRLLFNHPCKAFYWYGRKQSAQDANEFLDFTGTEDGTSYSQSGDLFDKASISLNNNLKVIDLGPKYFRYIQPKEHHTSIPRNDIYMYSFAMAPESVQPSGHLNCSRIETITIDLHFSNSTTEALEVVVYTQNYNIVKIHSGVSSLAWAS